MLSHRVRAATALLLLAACADPVTAPSSHSPRAGAAPSFTISDAANGGAPGFYFRPPVARALAAYPGSFDAALLPTLSARVCPIDPLGTCVGPDVVFDAGTKPALTLDAAAEGYAFRWPPPATGDYRARVYSGTALLGFFDVRVVANGSQLKSVPAGYVGVVSNAVLPVAFRVETSFIVVSITPPAAPAVVSLFGANFVATVTDLHGVAIANPVVTWASSSPGVATVNPWGVATGIAAGNAIITATSGGASDSAAVTVLADLPTVLGYSTVFVPRKDACGVNQLGRMCESLVGDVVTDGMRVMYGVDVAITNAGGLRADLTCPTTDLSADDCPAYTPPPYPITRGQAYAVDFQPPPFNVINFVTTLTVNGAELKTLLENGVSQMVTTGSGRFPQISGVCFTYSVVAPVGSRVTDVVRQASDGTCTGPAVDLTAASTYTLAENDYMAAGGDGYTNLASRATTQGRMDLVTGAYVVTHTPISPAIQGRIKCTTTGASGCPVVLP